MKYNHKRCVIILSSPGPHSGWQRRYETLRAFFVERMSTKAVAERFGYSAEYVRLRRHLFVSEKLNFTDPVPEGKATRRAVTTEIRKKIRALREKQFSASEISRLLSEEGLKISVRTVERVLAEEGFPRLPRRTRVQHSRTVKDAEIPECSERVLLEELDGKRFSCSGVGAFLFTPFLAQLDINRVVQEADERRPHSLCPGCRQSSFSIVPPIFCEKRQTIRS